MCIHCRPPEVGVLRTELKQAKETLDVMMAGQNARMVEISRLQRKLAVAIGQAEYDKWWAEEGKEKEKDVA